MAIRAIELHTKRPAVPTLCRVCHKEEENLISICNSLNGSTICDLLVDYTDLVVRSNDGGSSYICGRCIYELQVTVRFLRKCQCDATDTSSTRSELHTRGSDSEVAAGHLCNLCGKHFKKKNALKLHESRHTSAAPALAGPRHPCDLCNKKYTSRANLLIHKRTHTGERPHECTECHKKFISRSTLAVHHRTHTGPRRSLCGECGRQVAAHKLVEHQRRHLPPARPLHCPACPRTFREPRALTLHAAVHVPGGAGARALCPRTGCRRRYRHPQSLGRHLRTCRAPPPATAAPASLTR